LDRFALRVWALAFGKVLPIRIAAMPQLAIAQLGSLSVSREMHYRWVRRSIATARSIAAA
jgi:hypothetical protein